MALNFKDIITKYGSPLYVYDFDAIKVRLLLLRSLLHERAKVIYAVKANPNLQLLKQLSGLVDGLDLSSGGELKQALLAGYDSSSFSWAGPSKSPKELRLALESGCGSISVESLSDLLNIIEVAKLQGKPANISLRINPQKLINKFAIKMGGQATQFGVDEESLAEVVSVVKANSKLLNLVGLHIYAGTQCLDADALAENFAYNFELFGQIITEYQLTVTKLNFGGGFGVPYFDGNEQLDLTNAVDAFNKQVELFIAKHGDQFEFVLELGRYLVAEQGYYLTKVIATKDSRGKNYLVVDGGMHQNLSASGHLGQVIKKNYKIENVSATSSELMEYDIAGALCTPLDLLARSIKLPKTNVGDLIVVYNSGAYGYTSSPLLFLGHTTPAEVMVTDGIATLVREPKDITSFN